MMKLSRSWRLHVLIMAALLTMGAPIEVMPEPKVRKTQTGTATYYAKRFHGRTTASGVKFNQNALMAAHHRWPFGTMVRVTNRKNKRTVRVRIVDRLARRSRAIIDLSHKAARELRFLRTGQGRVPVRLEVLKWGKR
jgi:rare lipoprotein A